MAKQKLLIFGYWENNLGDDLFLKIFAERYPDSQIYILTSKKYKNIYSANNINCVIYDSFVYRVLNKVLSILKLPSAYYTFFSKKLDVIVCLGGSLFMETNNWKTQIKNLNYAIKKCKNSLVIGSNYGPYHSNEYLQVYSELFSKMSSVCFRDKSSYEKFSELSNVRFAPDVVLNLEYKEDKQHQLNFKDYYVISVINLENRENLCQYKDLYEKKILEIACNIIKNGSNVVLMSFCDKEGDMESILRIQSLIERKGNQVKVYSHTRIEESLNIIYQSNGIVATRFHAMILGFLYNKPVFPIVYSDKMENVIKDYLFDKKYISVKDIKNMDAEEVFQCLKIKPNIPPQIIELAKGQFIDLDNIVNQIR